MRVISLDWQEKNKLQSRLGGEANVISNNIVEAPQTSMLLPTSSNLHEFQASNETGDKGVAILDIICPNYDTYERPCTYYQVERLDTRNRTDENKHMSPDETITSLTEGEVVELVPVQQPSDFSVFTHPYSPFLSESKEK